MLHDLPGGVLEHVMTHLSVVSGHLGPLLNASAVSKQLALACEPCFEHACRDHGWRRARMPRGAAAAQHCFPWRALYRQHACRACGACGDFPVRHMRARPMQFLLCRSCVDVGWVRARMVKSSLMVDAEGLSGRKLLQLRRKGPRPRRRLVLRR